MNKIGQQFSIDPCRSLLVATGRSESNIVKAKEDVSEPIPFVLTEVYTLPEQSVVGTNPSEAVSIVNFIEWDRKLSSNMSVFPKQPLGIVKSPALTTTSVKRTL